MRVIDVVASALGLALLSPLFLVIAVWVKLTSPGPAFHRAWRVGRAERGFHLYKFRTMIQDADQLGPRITAAGDSRVTTAGRFLRRTKLDELPQLFNVLKGEMSLVGPRPEDPRYVCYYTPAERRVFAARPGITSPASILYHSEESLLTGRNWEQTYVEHVMPSKLAIELQYLEGRTIRSDLRVILHTLLVVVTPSRQPKSRQYI